MEQVLIMNQGGLRSVESQIGVKFGNSFVIEDSCLDGLQDIATSIDSEDVITRAYRCQLAVYGTVKNCLIPVIIHINDDENDMVDDKEDIFHFAIKILTHLSQPYDCLIYNNIPQLVKENVKKSNKKPQAILKGLVDSIKKQFIDTDIVSVIQQEIKNILEIGVLKSSEFETINSVLLLYCNLLFHTEDQLHLCSNDQTEGNASTALLKLLFEHGLKDILISCAASQHKSVWLVSMVQLITIMYKDSENTVNSCWFLLDDCFDADSPREFVCQDSDLISVRSYNTSTEVLCVVDNPNKSMNSLVVTEKMTQNQLNLVTVRENLRDFSIEFLKNGWPELIYGTKAVLVRKNMHNLPSMYYSWNVSFTLMLAQRHALPFKHVKPLISQYIIDYLVYIAVSNSEQLQAATHGGIPTAQLEDITSELSMSLMGIRYMLRCMQFYWMSEHITIEERQHLLTVKCMLAQSKEIRQLFSLLHRKFDSRYMSVNYLTMLVNVNHDFILMCDHLKETQPTFQFFDVKDHIQSFANQETICTYTHLLSHHVECTVSTLEKVFTMLYHVAVDLGHMDLVLQLPLMNAFNDIDDSPVVDKLSENCSDLIQTVFEYFLTCAETNPGQLACSLTDSLVSHRNNSTNKQQTWGTDQMDSNSGGDAWKNTDLEELEELALQFEGSMTFLDDVVSALHDRGIEHSASEVIVKLQQMDSEDRSENSSQIAKTTDTMMEATSILHNEEKLSLSSVSELVAKLQGSNKTQCVEWLQDTLLEMVYVQLGGTSIGQPFPEEPVIMNFMASDQSVPLIAYTLSQEKALLQDVLFNTLLYKLDIDPPNILKKEIYPRIPKEWNVHDLMMKASMLADVNMDNVKFSEKQLEYYREKKQNLPSERIDDSVRPKQARSSAMSEDMWIFYLQGLRKDKQKPTAQTTPWWQA